MNFPCYRRHPLSFAIIVLGVFLLSFVTAHSQSFNEDLVKSQFLVHFGDYVTNRSNEESLGEGSLKIGVVGSDMIPERISENLVRSKMSNRALILPIRQFGDIGNVDILYFSSGAKDLWGPFMPHARTAGVLTVGEGQGFNGSGGVIEFVVRKNRLRFRLNLNAAKESGLQINAKLIKLALQETS